jgi:hypothetical protein
MNAARSHDEKQAGILSVENRRDLGPRTRDERCLGFAAWDARENVIGLRQRRRRYDSDIEDSGHLLELEIVMPRIG